MSPTLDDSKRQRKPQVIRTLYPPGITLPFYPSLAIQIGFNDALLLIRIDVWLHNLRTNVKEIDGVKWLNLSAEQMHKRGFDHIDRRNINRIIESLIKRELLRVTYLPDSRTRWLTLNYDKIQMFDVEIIPLVEKPTLTAEPMSPARRRKAMASLGRRIKKEQEDKKRAKLKEQTDFPDL